MSNIEIRCQIQKSYVKFKGKMSNIEIRCLNMSKPSSMTYFCMLHPPSFRDFPSFRCPPRWGNIKTKKAKCCVSIYNYQSIYIYIYIYILFFVDLLVYSYLDVFLLCVGMFVYMFGICVCILFGTLFGVLLVHLLVLAFVLYVS